MSCVQNLSLDQIPKVVQTELSKKYPNVIEVQWSMEETNYEAEWVGSDGMEIDVIYDQYGTVISEELEITQAQLPPAIIETIQSSFSTFEMKESAIINEENVIYYEIELKHGLRTIEVFMDTDGNILDQLEEDDHRDESDNGNES